MQFAGRPVALDPTAGEWLADALRPASPGTVAALVGERFPAIARVFHPAVRYVGDDDVEVPWSEVAVGNGTTVHPSAQWGSVTGSMEYFENDDQAPLWHGAPARGHLPVTIARRLVPLLSRYTTAPDVCWFGIAEGGTVITDHPAIDIGPCSYWLVNGSIELATENFAAEPFEQSANLWWPADRSWLVATDVDLVTSYVAGSRECIGELLGTAELETARSDAAHRTTWDADQVNPPPPDA